MMFRYLTLGSNDLDRSILFYDALMAALGHRRLPGSEDGWAGWGHPQRPGSQLWLCAPFDGGAACPGNGAMIALQAGSPAMVDAAHRAGLAAGGRNEGAPGLRPQYGTGFYGAYLRDPDGNKLALVHVAEAG